MENENIVERAKYLLNNASEGDWAWVDDDLYTRTEDGEEIYLGYSWKCPLIGAYRPVEEDADGDLIMMAPKLVAGLLAEIERLTKLVK